MNVQTAGWFYQANNDRKGPFSSEQMSALLTAGAITEHTKVWSEALAEWTPLFRTELRALLGEKPIAPPDFEPADTKAAFVQADPMPAAPSASNVTYPRYDNRTLGKFVRWTSMVWFGLSLAVIVQTARAKTLEKQVQTVQFFESEVVAMVTLPLLLVMIAAFLLWKYRATANVFNIAGQQTITPAGAVYWYFVPVFWFWKPYEAMRNLWNGFGTEKSKVFLLHAWWGLWWLSIAAVIVGAIYTPEALSTVSDANTYLFWSYVVYGADALSFFLAAELIKEISEAESQAMASEQHA